VHGAIRLQEYLIFPLSLLELPSGKVVPMQKDFRAWMLQKRAIHARNHRPPLFSEGQVWWCFVGENVGVEIDGKGSWYTRPVLILTRYNRNSFFSIPLTSKLKTGTGHAQFRFKGRMQTAVLSQGRSFDYRRLRNQIGDVGSAQLRNIRAAFIALHGSEITKIDPPQSLAEVVGNPKAH
jgi:mRNA interferase MazF